MDIMDTVLNRTNYTSIDPKQFQKDSFGPMLVKNDILFEHTYIYIYVTRIFILFELHWRLVQVL